MSQSKTIPLIPRILLRHESLLGFPPTYQRKKNEHENLIKNQYPHNQIENDETPRAEYPIENDSEEGEHFSTSCHKY